MEDHPDEDIYSHLSVAVAFIEAALATGGRVLVYCTAGISRSATVVMAYIIHRSRISVEAAYEVVRASRPFVRPNKGFTDQLHVRAIDGLHC